MLVEVRACAIGVENGGGDGDDIGPANLYVYDGPPSALAIDGNEYGERSGLPYYRSSAVPYVYGFVGAPCAVATLPSTRPPPTRRCRIHRRRDRAAERRC